MHKRGIISTANHISKSNWKSNLWDCGCVLKPSIVHDKSSIFLIMVICSKSITVLNRKHNKD